MADVTIFRVHRDATVCMCWLCQSTPIYDHSPNSTIATVPMCWYFPEPILYVQPLLQLYMGPKISQGQKINSSFDSKIVSNKKNHIFRLKGKSRYTTHINKLITKTRNHKKTKHAFLDNIKVPWYIMWTKHITHETNQHFLEGENPTWYISCQKQRKKHIKT